MNTTSLCFSFALAAALQAQDAKTDPLQQAQVRLDKALNQAAALENGTFTARWDGNEFGGGAAVLLAARAGAAAAPAELNVKATGCWHGDLLSVRFDNSAEHELAQRGRRTAVRAGKDEWKLSRDRFADGSTRAYVPDPVQLLALLSQLGAKVVHREVGTLDDRPVETLSVILSGEQAAKAVLSGLLPSNSGLGFVVFGAGAGPPPVKSLIDLAIHLDPATGTLHRMDGRIHSAGNVIMAGGRVRVVAAGGAPVLVQPADEEGEDDGSKQTLDEAVKQVPDKFQGGLPVRKLKDCATTRFELRLSEQGTTKAPELDAKVQALLGR